MKHVLLLAVSIAIGFTTAQSQAFLNYYQSSPNTPGDVKFSCIKKVGSNLIVLGSYFNSTSDNGILYYSLNTSGTINSGKYLQLVDNDYLCVPTNFIIDGTDLIICGYIESSPNHGFVLSFDLGTTPSLNWINVITQKSRIYDMLMTSDGTLVICGEIDHAVSPLHDDDALFYEVNISTGAFTRILQSYEDPGAPDTYLAMDAIGNSVYLTGRFEIDDIQSKQRPIIVNSELDGTINFAN